MCTITVIKNVTFINLFAYLFALSLIISYTIIN